jgi:hypothetical protein
VTGKFKSTSRVRKLVQGIPIWQPTSSPGREVAAVPTPVEFVRPLAQYAVRTPSKDHKDGYYSAVVFSTHLDLPMGEVVSRYDGRAGVEADLKSEKRGLALAVIRKRRLAAQKVVILLTQLAHTVLIWARGWLVAQVPRWRECGIVRLVEAGLGGAGTGQTGREAHRARSAASCASARTGRLLWLPSPTGLTSNPGVLVTNLGSCASSGPHTGRSPLRGFRFLDDLLDRVARARHLRQGEQGTGLRGVGEVITSVRDKPTKEDTAPRKRVAFS